MNRLPDRVFVLKVIAKSVDWLTRNCRLLFYGKKTVKQSEKVSKQFAVTLAFAVIAVDRKICNCEIKVIKNWAQSNIGAYLDSGKKNRQLDKALRQAVRFFRKGNTIDIFKTCNEIVEIASLIERYDILELCLNVVRTNGIASAKQLSLLKNMAIWLEVDHGRFRSMVERILPANMHEVEDVEIVLGITANMSRETARQCINNEYRKWNARVTNLDPAIQNQANYMLQFIARARSEYVEQ